MLETKRVSDLVRDDVFDQATHQIVGQGKFFCSRVQRTNLQEIPVALQVHDVVVILNVRLENLAGARIGNVRT